MLKKFFSFLTGYYYIQIEGFYIEKFINICIRQNIILWKTRRDKSDVVYARIGIEDFEKAKEIAMKNQVILTVKRKVGAKFLVEKYKNRRVFIIAILAVVIIIFTLSKFIWKIDVEVEDDGSNYLLKSEETTDNENKDFKISNKEYKSEIQNLLKDEGVHIGTLKSKINSENISNNIRLKKDDISWVGMEIKGTKLTIKVVPATKKPDIINENDYTNIVAKKDGKILKVTAQNGTAICKKGDKVKKGDILIAGYMDGEHTERSYVNSNGDVKAKIIYKETTKIDKKESEKYKTGKKQIKFSIKFKNFKINLFKRLSNFKIYDTIYTSKKIFSKHDFNIEVIKYDVFEEAVRETDNSKEQAKEKGEAISKEKLNTKINGEIINEITNITEYETYYLVDVSYEVIESIGTKEKINF